MLRGQGWVISSHGQEVCTSYCMSVCGCLLGGSNLLASFSSALQYLCCSNIGAFSPVAQGAATGDGISDQIDAEMRER